MLEETAYYLPDKLTWELTNVEMLTSLEVNYVISSTTVPTALSAQIVRICDMKRRAEVEMLQEEMSQINFYTSEHSLVVQHIDSLKICYFTLMLSVGMFESVIPPSFFF